MNLSWSSLYWYYLTKSDFHKCFVTDVWSLSESWFKIQGQKTRKVILEWVILSNSVEQVHMYMLSAAVNSHLIPIPLTVAFFFNFSLHWTKRKKLTSPEMSVWEPVSRVCLGKHSCEFTELELKSGSDVSVVWSTLNFSFSFARLCPGIRERKWH